MSYTRPRIAAVSSLALTGRRDLIAGLTVAAVALPQGIAYALIAGVDPKYGVYSAIVVTAVASVFGSSSHLINGPTSAISLLVFSSLAFIDPEDRTVLPSMRSKPFAPPAFRKQNIGQNLGRIEQATRTASS